MLGTWPGSLLPFPVEQRRDTVADSTEGAPPNRLYALLSIIGGGLMIGAFFLPDHLGLTGDVLPSTTSVISMWEVVYRIGSGTNAYVSHTPSNQGQPHLIAAILVGLPMILGALIVVLGVWSFVRRSGALRAGFFGAAVGLTAIGELSNTLYMNATIIAEFSVSRGSSLPIVNEAWLGLGSVVLLLGLLLVLAAGIAAMLRRLT